MADLSRSKASTSSSMKAAYGRKGKTSHLTAHKNQQPPGAALTSVLPRIDRRGELPQKSHAPSLLLSPKFAKNDGLSILLPPRRPSSKDALPNEETSPTFHDDKLDGPRAKAAWCTPRPPAPELPTGSHVASFFAAPEGNSRCDDSSPIVSMPPPLRLQSVEESINANEERYRIDMEQLASNDDKFVEISISANQHLEHVHNQLPTISDTFKQTASALESLSTDIATLQQQHEIANNDMTKRFEAAMDNNAEEMMTLSKAHANEKAKLVEAHDRELQIADKVFREKVAELEGKYIEMEQKYSKELQELRETSECRVQALEDVNRVEKDERERSAKAELEDFQAQAQAEFDALRIRSQTAYTELQQRSNAEYAELQRTSSDEVAAVNKTLTAEIFSLKQQAAASLIEVVERSERELKEHRKHSDDALQRHEITYAKEREHLLEKAAEATARFRMFESEQCTRMEDRRCQETKALRSELEATKTEYSTHVEELHRRHLSEFHVLKATSEAEKTLLLRASTTETETIRSVAAQKLSQAISLYEDRLRLMTETHATEMNRNHEEAAHAREVLVTKYELDLTSLQSERAREKEALILHYETELEAFKHASRKEHDTKVKLHETQIARLREAHSSRVLALEMAMREQTKQVENMICEKSAELDSRQERIDVLEATEIALKERHEHYAERSLELVEEKNMALSELESEIWRLDQRNLEREMTLDSTNRALKTAEEDAQVKASTILELTFVIKSRDDEIEKLRNALLDTVQTVNTKTEILELTTETLSTKAKELEATKSALRLESGKLFMVEESMSQKVGMLENSELKMESMRLNMENMRLEMKRMLMDMKLQLEHTEGEIELKNGEIRRLHGTQSELKQKNAFCHQTIERLEESLAFAQRQGEEAQRRIELLRLETTQAAQDYQKSCDEVLSKEHELMVMTSEKQTIATEKQRLEIQFNNLIQVNQTLHEKVELHAMRNEEIQCQCWRLLEETGAEKDERVRSEKHLHMLELSAAKVTIRHLEGVEERLSDATSKLETVMGEKKHLHAKVKTLKVTLKKYEKTEEQLDAAHEQIELKKKLIDDKTQNFIDLNKQLYKTQDEARYLLDMSQMEIEDSRSNFCRVAASKNEMVRLNKSLEMSLSSLRGEKEQLMLALGQEKREIVRRAEDLQETIAGLRKEGARAASEISDLKNALSEKKKELEYLQENVGEQTTDPWKLKSALDALSSAHTELQMQFLSVCGQRQKESEEHQSMILSLQQDFEQSLDIQRQETNLLMVQHDNQVVRLVDGHRSETVQLIESHRAQMAQMTEDHLSQVTKLKEDHLTEVTRWTAQVSELTAEHQSKVSHFVEVATLTASHRVQMTQMIKDHGTQVAHLTEVNRSELVLIQQDHDNEVAHLARHEVVRLDDMRESDSAQEQVRLELTVDEQIRAVCAHSLELLTIHVAHQHEIDLLEQTVEQEHETETEASDQLALERYEQALGDHQKTADELEETFAHNTELMRLRLTEAHLTKGNELAERSRLEEELHTTSLATVREELSVTSNSLKRVEDVVVALKTEINKLQTQVHEMTQEVAERDAVVSAKNATIDNVRKELNLLLKSSKSTRSSEQFVALLRQQFETHLMEVYHIELNALEDFVLEDESDLLGCLKGFFAMRCYRGIAPQGCNWQPESSKVVAAVDEICEHLQEYDRMIAALDQNPVQMTSDCDNLTLTPSRRISSLRGELGRLNLHVDKVFTSTRNAVDKEDMSTDRWIQLVDNLTDFFDKLAIPIDLESAVVRSREVMNMLNENEKLMLDAKASSVKGDIQSMEDVGRLFTVIDQLLARARQVTKSDKIVRLADLTILFEEWEALHKELDAYDSANDNEQEVSPPRPSLTVGTHLRSAETLAFRQETADFFQRCKKALQLPVDKATSTEIVEAIEQLMKILEHFELLQPKLGSPRRQATATDSSPTIENKVTAVLAFVEELQLIADFAQNILSDEVKSQRGSASNESSSSSLEALHALKRTPSSASTPDELQIQVGLPVDDRMQRFEQDLCEFSNEEEGDRQREAFFALSDENSSLRSPSPFLADSLMEISLVMSDHHRLLSQTARWVSKSRQDRPCSQTYSMGTEISRLVREYYALLSLSRRLFQLKDPRQELVSLLEGVALLERMTERLAIFQRNATQDTDDTSCYRSFSDSCANPSESTASLGQSEIDSVESLSRPVLASIEDMARHLQDYDYFVQQIKLDEDPNHLPPVIKIEVFVHEITEKLRLVEQSKELLGLEDPVHELLPVLVGAQEVLRQAKQLRSESSAYFDKNSVEIDGEELLRVVTGDGRKDTGNGIDAVLLGEMDAVMEDLQSYNGILKWMKQVLPQPEAVKSVADLKDRVNGILAQVDAVTVDNTNLRQERSDVKCALGQMEKTRDHFIEEASKEGTVLQQVAASEAQQQREDMAMETAFLRQHNLLSDGDGADKETTMTLSVDRRLEIYTRLLECADRLRSEKTELEATLNADKEALEAALRAEKDAVESSLNDEIQRQKEKLESIASELAQTRQEMDKALAEERAFLESKQVFSSFISVEHTVAGPFPRLEIYQQLHDKLVHLLDEKQIVESCATQEYNFLRTNDLLPPNDVQNGFVPTSSELSAIRLEMFQRLVKSREREVALESEKTFLVSHGVPAFDHPMEIYEQYVQTRKQLAGLTTELEKEVQFLVENQLCSCSELSDGTANVTTPFASSFRLNIYRRLLQNEIQARESTQQLKERMEQQLYRQIEGDNCIIASLTAKVERLEASLMQWQESAYVPKQEWDRRLLEEEDKHRSLIRQHEDVQKQTTEDHARTLKEIIKARDSAVALASATHAEALEEVTKEHERRLAAALHEQAQQLELAAFVDAENETRKQVGETSASHSSTSISVAQTRAQLLEKFAKRDTTAISLIYKAIRFTTDILSAAPTTTSTVRTMTGSTSEVSTEITQTVLACVKELKTLKEFLVQSLEQVTKDEDQVPPPFANAPYTNWMAAAVTRATADKESAIDLALCSHREFMSFADLQLVTRQEELEKALARVYDKLKTAATNGGFTPDQEKLLALELEVACEREARENGACKFRLNEEFYRRLLDERKEMEITQAANVESLREECKTLRLKLEKMEQQTMLPQFRTPLSNTYTSAPRAAVISPQTPRVLKTAAVSNNPMPMRPERPRGGGNAHKERFVSDLKRETGQRRTTTTTRRSNEWRGHEDAITENSGSQLEQDFRAMQTAKTTHHAPALESVIPTALTAPATAPNSSLQNQELWYQGVRSIQYVSFFISIFHVPRQQLFRVEVFNSDTEQQQQTVYVTWTEMQGFLHESRKAVRLGIVLPAESEMTVPVPQQVRTEIMDVLFERVRVYGEGKENILLGFE